MTDVQIVSDTDPNPTFSLNTVPIRIQGFDDQKLEKFTAKKFNFFIKNYRIITTPIPGPP